MAGYWPYLPGLALAAVLTVGATEPAAAAQPVEVKDAWVRAPVPGQKVAGAYMELNGRAKGALVSVTSPVAERGELHSTKLEGGVMKMRAIGKVEFAAGERVRLEPGGLHVMLFELKRPLKPGETVPLTLTVEGADSSRAVFTVPAEVRTAAVSSAHKH